MVWRVLVAEVVFLQHSVSWSRPAVTAFLAAIASALALSSGEPVSRSCLSPLPFLALRSVSSGRYLPSSFMRRLIEPLRGTVLKHEGLGAAVHCRPKPSTCPLPASHQIVLSASGSGLALAVDELLGELDVRHRAKSLR